MSADFWAGYVSGAIGIVVGNPLDLIKTQIQAGNTQKPSPQLVLSPETSRGWNYRLQNCTSLARGAAAPILGYGALNALLFVTYNRSLALLETGSLDSPPSNPSSLNIFTAGALGGLATFVVSAPTELVKCRAQVSNPARSSWQVAREMWRADGIRGLYMGGGITSVRDAVGYGFYFWSYELSKRAFAPSASFEPEGSASSHSEALRVLLCGGLAGIVTWVSIFPLDVIKTRVQTHDLLQQQQQAHRSGVVQSSPIAETRSLLGEQSTSTEQQQQKAKTARPSTFQIAAQAYRTEGLRVFFRGIGVCSARAFVVNAVQWAVYEWMMKTLSV